MKSTDFQRLSVQYLYGELTDEEKSSFEAHLKDCEGCRNELEEMKQTVDLLEKMPETEPSPAIRRAVLQYATSARLRKKTFWEFIEDLVCNNRKAFRFAMAIIMILIAFSLLIGHFRGPPVSETARSSPLPSKVAIGKTESPTAGQSPAEIEKLTNSAIEEKIGKVEKEIKTAQLSDLSFSDSMDFYKGDFDTGGSGYEAFADSRPYRKIFRLRMEAENVKRNILSL